MAIVGDFGTGEAEEVTVALAMRFWASDHALDAVVSVGDNVYGKPSRPFLEEVWYQPYGWVERRGVHLIAALGNHDVEFRGTERVMDTFEIPDPWYETHVGPVQLIILDSNRMESSAQLDWLRQTLDEPPPSWRVVVVHEPPYSCGESGGSRSVRRLTELFQAGGVNLVLSGHHHSYQRFAPVDSVTYLVTGGGGAGLQDVLYPDCPADLPQLVAWNDTRHHFVYLSFDDRTLEAQAVAGRGDILDSFRLEDS
jgi:3',5'-cyclic AMP phosphodiesterase CpdA